MMRFVRSLLWLMLLCGSLKAAPLPTEQISVDFDHVEMSDALKFIAKLSHLNISISPQIKGKITLNLHQVKVCELLDFILTTNHLVRYYNNSTWMIVTHHEWIKQKQQDQHFKQLKSAVDTLQLKSWFIRYAQSEMLLKLMLEKAPGLFSDRGYRFSDRNTNQIIVQETQDHILAINRIIQQLDRPSKQVFIKARIASVDQDMAKELGLEFSLHARHKDKDQNWMLLNSVYLNFLDLRLQALEQEGHAEFISSPSLLALNDETASIEAGEEIPYQEISRSGGTGVTFKKAVLSLKVTPRVFPDNRVLLSLQVNQDKPSRHLILGVPAISTREVATNVLVKDGETVVLGGIFETNHDRFNDRVPILGRLPWIGYLFQHHNVAHAKRKLLIFVTPKILKMT